MWRNKKMWRIEKYRREKACEVEEENTEPKTKNRRKENE